MAVQLNAITSAGGGFSVTPDSSGVLSFQSAGTTYMTMDASGNLGIGTSSPSSFTNYRFITLSGTSGSYYQASVGSTVTATLGAEGADAFVQCATTTGNLRLYTNNTERMRIDASGNVGIGTTSQIRSGKLSVSGDVSNNSNINWGASGNGRLYSDANWGCIFQADRASPSVAEFMWQNGSGTERMRIDTSGNVLVGVTSPGSYAAGSAIGTTGYISRSGTAGSFGNNRFNIFWNGSAARLWIDTVDQGSIAISSDYRIKKDIQAQTLTAIDRIAQLKPVTYTYADNEDLNWKADGVAREGFIAHELAEIIPSAVDGEKDAENQIQSLKLDALCSVMVKAIQEQQAIIEQLKADVEALKGGK